MRQQELDEMQSQFDPTPGPGSYTGLYSNSSFIKQPLKAKYQRMG